MRFLISRCPLDVRVDDRVEIGQRAQQRIGLRHAPQRIAVATGPFRNRALRSGSLAATPPCGTDRRGRALPRNAVYRRRVIASGPAGPRLGLQLPEVERRVGWPEHLAIARAAEEAGLDSLWVGDHLLYRGDGRRERGPWEAWTLLAALAAVDRARALGPLVACAGFHPPGMLARMAATIDEISGGRFVLGLGAGWNEARVPRLRPPVRPSRRALRGGVRDRPPRCWRASASRSSGPPLAGRGRVLLRRPARRELMIGSNGPRMLARAPARGRLEHLVRRLRQHAGGLRRAQRGSPRVRARRARPGRGSGAARAGSSCSTARRASDPLTPGRRRSRARWSCIAARLRSSPRRAPTRRSSSSARSPSARSASSPRRWCCLRRT